MIFKRYTLPAPTQPHNKYSTASKDVDRQSGSEIRIGNQNRGQSTNLDTTAACILTRRSDQGGTRLHDHGCQDFLTDPYCLNPMRPLSGQTPEGPGWRGSKLTTG